MSVLFSAAARRAQKPQCFRRARQIAGVVCILLSTPRMPSVAAGTMSIALSIVVLVHTCVARAAGPSDAITHVRADTADVAALIAEGAAQSPSVRALLDRIDGSDVVAYVRLRTFTSTELEGRVMFVSSVGGFRYVVIELACGRRRAALLATLGHELQHVVEIASAPSIVNARTLASHYERIGEHTNAHLGLTMFETDAAREAERHVRRELSQANARSTDGR
jgi:hypothetical protein